MAFTVVYDACALYPAALRDLLIRLALTRLVQARWTDEILDECPGPYETKNLTSIRWRSNEPRSLMNTAVLDCLVTGHKSLLANLSLPDPDDRHVLAAAIRCGAQAIVTFNLKDFPEKALEPFGIEAIDPDDYVAGLVDLAPGRVAQVLREQSADLKNPPMSAGNLLRTLERQGLPQSSAKLRALLP